MAGCAGGQSGAEDFCGEGTQESDNNRDATFVANGTDEDGGVDDAGDANIEFSADDNGKEATSGPTSCPPPDETGEY